MIVNDRKVNRIVAFALVIMLVFIVSFSEYFIHREANHECHDEECPICVVINQSNNILSNLLRSTFLKSVFFIFISLVVSLKQCSQVVIPFSLIRNNIRLNE